MQSGVPIKVVQEFLGHRDIKMTLRYAHLAPTNLIAAVDVINKVNGNGNADTAYSLDTKKYREGDKAEMNKLVNTEVKNIIERGDPTVHNDTTVRPKDERRLPFRNNFVKTLPSQSFYVFITQSKRTTGRNNYN